MLHAFRCFVICEESSTAAGPALSVGECISEFIVFAPGDALPRVEIAEVFPISWACWNADLGFVVRKVIATAVVDALAFSPVSEHVGIGWAVVQTYASICAVIFD